MNRQGEPYVPPYPHCPAEREGARITPHPSDFMWVTADDSSREVVEGWGVFTDENDTDLLRTAATEAPYDTEHAGRIYGGAQFDEKIGEIFCDRILNCRGLTQGECWALGPKAVQEVIASVQDTRE